jgi:hypothetical protein
MQTPIVYRILSKSTNFRDPAPWLLLSSPNGRTPLHLGANRSPLRTSLWNSEVSSVLRNPLHTFLALGLLQNRTQVKSKPPSSTIQLHDAYLDSAMAVSRSSKLDYHTEEKERRQLTMTYRTGYVLDYVWTSRKVDIEDTLFFHPKACTKEPQKWPSEEHPSDHLPIGVDLDWH